MTVQRRKIYQILWSVFLTHINQERISGVKHNDKTIKKYSLFIPFDKLLTVTTENILLSLLITILEKPVNTFFDLINSTDFEPKKITNFKNDIFLYKENLIKDLEYLSNYGRNIDANIIFNSYLKKKIKFYTLYFFVNFLVVNEIEPDKQKKKILVTKLTRIQKFIYRRINTVMLFITFKEESKEYIDKKIREIITSV